MRKVKVSTETFTEENKPIVTEKNEFENRDEALVTAQFGNFGLSGFSSKKKIKMLHSKTQSQVKKNPLRTLRNKSNLL